MLDLSPFDTLLYWYPNFISNVPKSSKKGNVIPLKLKSVYEITYDLVQEENYIQVYNYVENAVHQYLNDVQALLDESDKNTRTYILHEKVSKPLEELLTRLYEQVCDEEFPTADRRICFEILQHFLVWCYAEVCEKRLELLKEAEVPLFQIYQGYLQTKEPHPPVIHERITTLEAQPVLTTHPLMESKPVPSKITFEQLIQTPDIFQSAEDLMMENNLIDENRNLIDAHGNKIYLAAVYVHLIQQGYFRERIFPGNLEIRPIDIRKFLDIRYNVKLPKQFRNWMNNKEEHTAFIRKYYWLENLKQCQPT